jgi:hypothetical protein
MSSSFPRLIFSVFLIGVLLTACSSLSRDAAESSYRPLLATGSDPSSRSPRGTLKGDFEWARDAASLKEAVYRWEQFLRVHEPRRGEYEDGFQKIHIDAAKFELMRVYYLLGQIDAGDRILKQIDPLAVNGSSGSQ